MPIPNFQSVMLPLLQHLVSGESGTADTVDAMAAHFALTPEELAVRLPSGRQGRFKNRIAWAKAHLKAAGLIESPKRGVYRLTDLGRQLLHTNPVDVGIPLLKQFPGYVEFREGAIEPTRTNAPQSVPPASEDQTPDDLIEEGYSQYRASLIADLREHVQAMAPSAFEQLVVDVLSAMGYGGSQDNAGLVVGRGGDGGIDGVIREDQLGLETIYVQAKRWQGSVGRPEIQRFAGALQGRRARKGVFITSSTFSADARGYVESIATTIALVDGVQLAELMIAHDVGVSTVRKLEIKRVDSDYFEVAG
jgi:restriction system protein